VVTFVVGLSFRSRELRYRPLAGPSLTKVLCELFGSVSYPTPLDLPTGVVRSLCLASWLRAPLPLSGSIRWLRLGGWCVLRAVRPRGSREAKRRFPSAFSVSVFGVASAVPISAGKPSLNPHPDTAPAFCFTELPATRTISTNDRVFGAMPVPIYMEHFLPFSVGFRGAQNRGSSEDATPNFE